MCTPTKTLIFAETKNYMADKENHNMLAEMPDGVVKKEYIRLLEELINRRYKKRLSQQDLANLSGLYKSYINRLEKGVVLISLPKLLAMCDALDLDIQLKPRKKEK